MMHKTILIRWAKLNEIVTSWLKICMGTHVNAHIVRLGNDMVVAISNMKRVDKDSFTNIFDTYGERGKYDIDKLFTVDGTSVIPNEISLSLIVNSITRNHLSDIGIVEDCELSYVTATNEGAHFVVTEKELSYRDKVISNCVSDTIINILEDIRSKYNKFNILEFNLFYEPDIFKYRYNIVIVTSKGKTVNYAIPSNLDGATYFNEMGGS